MKPGTNHRIYTGGSMTRVFQFGDTLNFEYAELSKIKPGDVLIYEDFGRTRDGIEIVHRVRKILPEGILMQGDNNPYPDTTLVTAKNLVGKVTHFERNRHRLPVQLSRFDRIRLRWRRTHCRLRCIIWGWSVLHARRLYGWLRKINLIERPWRPPIVKVRFCSEKGPLIKYIWRDRTVATRWITTGKFTCVNPCDLLMQRHRPSRKNSG